MNLKRFFIALLIVISVFLFAGMSYAQVSLTPSIALPLPSIMAGQTNQVGGGFTITIHGSATPFSGATVSIASNLPLTTFNFAGASLGICSRSADEKSFTCPITSPLVDGMVWSGNSIVDATLATPGANFRLQFMLFWVPWSPPIGGSVNLVLATVLSPPTPPPPLAVATFPFVACSSQYGDLGVSVRNLGATSTTFYLSFTDYVGNVTNDISVYLPAGTAAARGLHDIFPRCNLGLTVFAGRLQVFSSGTVEVGALEFTPNGLTIPVNPKN